MDGKKVAAAVLALAMTAGIAGCDKTKKHQEQIGELMDNYVEAFMFHDADDILELTNWDEDAKEYKEIKNTFDRVEESMYDYEEYIYSTIEINYDMDDLDLKEKKATLEFEYEIVDWEQAYYGTYSSFEEFLDALKNVKDTNKFEGKIVFELEGKEWKISRISKFSGMFEYVDWFPDVRSDVDYTDDTDYSDGPTPDDDYKNEVAACLQVLSDNEKAIRKDAEIYGKEFTNIYDMNADGHYEVMFVSADDVNDDNSSASLHIYSFNWYAGECIEMITIPYVVFPVQDGHGGKFSVVVTYGGIVITYASVEQDVTHVETKIYGFDFDLQRNYSRAVSENADTLYFEKKDGNYSEISEDEYMNNVKLLVDNSIVLIGYNEMPSEDEVEYPYKDLPDLGFSSFDGIYNSYKDLIS